MVAGEGARGRCARRFLAALAIVGALGCTPERPEGRRERPSVLLVVLDTVRRDAVGAYGTVAGTTPTLDRLAAAGVRYERAYAQAPWTLPSHATLFTGLLPSAHGVSWRRTRAPATLTTLAERLADGGYETVGISENPWVGAPFGLAQGFARFEEVAGFRLDPDAPVPAPADSALAGALARWLATRRDPRPFFLFVNVLDAHNPYLVRAENPFLPPGVDTAQARAVPQAFERYLCSADDHAEALAILRGLYLGGVAAADAKLAEVLRQLGAAGLGADLVTIVTSDHGEHFGEQARVGHQFSVHDALLRVPLVVHGVRGTPPGVVEEPVRLADVMPTVLTLVGLPLPPGLWGVPLPLTARAAPAPPRPVVAEHDDSADGHAPDEAELARLIRAGNAAVRAGCGPDDRVFGAMRAFVRPPLKLVAYARYPAALYDLGADPAETRDLAATRPRVVAAFAGALASETAAGHGGASSGAPDAPPVVSEATPFRLAPEVAERLRALGYLPADGPRTAGASRASPGPAGRRE